MKHQEIKAIAKSKDVKLGSMKKPELIRAIQQAEGNFDCYGSVTSGYCDQINCLWHKDCVQFSTK